MELIRISDSKLKIMLSAEDMAHYAITPEVLNYENTETRRAVWQILDEAKQQTGFDAASDRVLIQVYPSRAGGCELYITKILTPAAGNLSPAERPSRAEGRIGVYAFSALGELLASCRQLLRSGYSAESAAYTGEDGRYYLILREKTGEGLCGAPPAYNPAEEYGERLNGGIAKMAYIKEHATCLCPSQAIEHLAMLA